MKKILLISTGLFFVLAVKSQDKRSFDAWDGNNDKKIDLKEYSLNSQMFGRWDGDNDNRISKSEFTDSYFSLLDVNSDDQIDKEELQKVGFMISFQETQSVKTGQTGEMKTGKSGMAGQTKEKSQKSEQKQSGQTGTNQAQSVEGEQDKAGQAMKTGAGMTDFGDLDSNSDDLVTNDEFAKSNLMKSFLSWDKNKDNYLSKTEFYNNTFSWWDVNGDGNISQGEFARMTSISTEESWQNRIF